MLLCKISLYSDRLNTRLTTKKDTDIKYNILAIILMFTHISLNAYIFPAPDPHSGTTIHDYKEITPIFPRPLNSPDKKTTAYFLKQELQRYLVSASSSEVKSMERLSNRYWEYASLANDNYINNDDYDLQ
jgi:hypothetical protein